MTKYVSYRTAIHSRGNNFILCNEITDVDPESIWDNMEYESLDSESETEYPEIYQYYLSDCSADDKEWLQKSFPDLIFAYSDKLNLWVLCVDHFGTMWESVPTLCRNDEWLKWNPEKEYKND